MLCSHAQAAQHCTWRFFLRFSDPEYQSARMLPSARSRMAWIEGMEALLDRDA